MKPEISQSVVLEIRVENSLFAFDTDTNMLLSIANGHFYQLLPPQARKHVLQHNTLTLVKASRLPNPKSQERINYL